MEHGPVSLRELVCVVESGAKALAAIASETMSRSQAPLVDLGVLGDDRFDVGLARQGRHEEGDTGWETPARGNRHTPGPFCRAARRVGVDRDTVHGVAEGHDLRGKGAGGAFPCRRSVDEGHRRVFDARVTILPIDTASYPSPDDQLALAAARIFSRICSRSGLRRPVEPIAIPTPAGRCGGRNGNQTRDVTLADSGPYGEPPPHGSELEWPSRARHARLVAEVFDANWGSPPSDRQVPFSLRWAVLSLRAKINQGGRDARSSSPGNRMA